MSDIRLHLKKDGGRIPDGLADASPAAGPRKRIRNKIWFAAVAFLLSNLHLPSEGLWGEATQDPDGLPQLPRSFWSGQ